MLQGKRRQSLWYNRIGGAVRFSHDPRIYLSKGRDGTKASLSISRRKAAFGKIRVSMLTTIT